MRYFFRGKDENSNWKKGYIESNSRREGLIQLETMHNVKTPITFKESKEIPIIEKTKKQFEKAKMSFNKSNKNNKNNTSIRLNATEDNWSTLISQLSKSNKGINLIMNTIKDINTDDGEEDKFFNIEDKAKVDKRTIKNDAKEKGIDWNMFKAENINKAPKELRNAKVNTKEIINFTEQLALMLGSGISLTQSLSKLELISTNKKFKKVIKDIENDVQNGEKISKSLAKYPKIFDHLYIALIQVGERGGTIETCLEDIAFSKAKQLKVQKGVKSATIYPKMVLGLLAVLGVGASKFFIPMFEELFADNETPLPELTKVIFYLADKIFPLIIGTVVLIIMITIIRKLVPKIDVLVKYLFDKLSLKLPLIKSVVLVLNMYQFSSTLSLMLKNGIRLTDSLQLVKQTMSNVILQQEVEEALQSIIRGGALSEALDNQKHFAKLLSGLISVGEKTGRMPEVLERSTKYYDAELNEKIDTVMRSIEPATIILLGIIITPVLVGIYLPLMEVSSGGFVS